MNASPTAAYRASSGTPVLAQKGGTKQNDTVTDSNNKLQFLKQHEKQRQQGHTQNQQQHDQSASTLSLTSVGSADDILACYQVDPTFQQAVQAYWMVEEATDEELEVRNKNYHEDAEDCSAYEKVEDSSSSNSSSSTSSGSEIGSSTSDGSSSNATIGKRCNESASNCHTRNDNHDALMTAIRAAAREASKRKPTIIQSSPQAPESPGSRLSRKVFREQLSLQRSDRSMEPLQEDEEDSKEDSLENLSKQKPHNEDTKLVAFGKAMGGPYQECHDNPSHQENHESADLEKGMAETSTSTEPLLYTPRFQSILILLLLFLIAGIVGGALFWYSSWQRNGGTDTRVDMDTTGIDCTYVPSILPTTSPSSNSEVPTPTPTISSDELLMDETLQLMLSPVPGIVTVHTNSTTNGTTSNGAAMNHTPLTDMPVDVATSQPSSMPSTEKTTIPPIATSNSTTTNHTPPVMEVSSQPSPVPVPETNIPANSTATSTDTNHTPPTDVPAVLVATGQPSSMPSPGTTAPTEAGPTTPTPTVFRTIKLPTADTLPTSSPTMLPKIPSTTAPTTAEAATPMPTVLRAVKLPTTVTVTTSSPAVPPNLPSTTAPTTAATSTPMPTVLRAIKLPTTVTVTTNSPAVPPSTPSGPLTFELSATNPHIPSHTPSIGPSKRPTTVPFLTPTTVPAQQLTSSPEPTFDTTEKNTSLKPFSSPISPPTTEAPTDSQYPRQPTRHPTVLSFAAYQQTRTAEQPSPQPT